MLIALFLTCLLLPSCRNSSSAENDPLIASILDPSQEDARLYQSSGSNRASGLDKEIEVTAGHLHDSLHNLQDTVRQTHGMLSAHDQLCDLEHATNVRARMLPPSLNNTSSNSMMSSGGYNHNSSSQLAQQRSLELLQRRLEVIEGLQKMHVTPSVGTTGNNSGNGMRRSTGYLGQAGGNGSPVVTLASLVQSGGSSVLSNSTTSNNNSNGNGNNNTVPRRPPPHQRGLVSTKLKEQAAAAAASTATSSSAAAASSGNAGGGATEGSGAVATVPAVNVPSAAANAAALGGTGNAARRLNETLKSLAETLDAPYKKLHYQVQKEKQQQQSGHQHHPHSAHHQQTSSLSN